MTSISTCEAGVVELNRRPPTSPVRKASLRARTDWRVPATGPGECTGGGVVSGREQECEREAENNKRIERKQKANLENE